MVQLPTDAYAVSGTTMTFTEAPATGDKVEVRKITTTSTITNYHQQVEKLLLQLKLQKKLILKVT